MIMPDLRRAGADPQLAARRVRRPRRAGRGRRSAGSSCRSPFPAVVAGSIFTFSLTLGDYITPQLVSSTQFIGNVVYANVGVANNLPLAAAFAHGAGRRS